MEIGTILSSGGIVTAISGILYFVFNRRVNRIEDGAVYKDLCDERHKRDEDRDRKIDATHDAVIAIKAHMKIE
jgi:hypothetical protein